MNKYTCGLCEDLGYLKDNVRKKGSFKRDKCPFCEFRKFVKNQKP